MEEDREMLNSNVVGNNSVAENYRCIKLEKQSKKAEVRCAELEFELQKKNDHCEALMAKLVVMEVEKFAVEDELKVLRVSSEGLTAKKEVANEKEREVVRIIDLTDDSEVAQLMTENTVLECEKKKAESEVEIWRKRYKNLESWALQFGLGSGSYYQENNGKKKHHEQINNEDCWHQGANLDSKVCPVRKFRKHLTFEIEDSPLKKMNPSTPPISVIDIDAISDGPSISQHPLLHKKGSENVAVSMSFAGENGKMSSNSYAQNNEEDLNSGDDVPLIPICKRKRTCNVVTSESEHDDDDNDNVPLCKLKSIHIPEVSPNRVKCDINGKISRNTYAQNNEEYLNFGDDDPLVAMPKRRHACNVVTSESERDDDDDVPLSKLMRMHIPEVSLDQVRCEINSSVTAAASADDKATSTRKRRKHLVPLRKFERKSQEGKISSCRSNKAKHQENITTDDVDAASESEDDLSGCEDKDLSDFVVDDSDESNCDDTSSSSENVSNDLVDTDYSNSQDIPDNDKDSGSQDLSDADMDYGKILSQIQRKKDHIVEWEYEADMLAAFGKDPELCMKAVCVLYRQQTEDEQMSKGALHRNGRGFNRLDADRGCNLAEFLTDGAPYGGLKKTVKELQEYDPEAVELCRTLADRYSKQLYQIYKNKEDQFFP
ncbi:hypothetical protein TanjilG_18250 [Lupinus angustifolius]|uniref:Uncharacterized protein n=2 Tax=Lupinus angustifolius TaxID=3871 RepID=A0A1J7G8Y1_LUPAN|nr:hypothetical protein TanjilG_18250 [Lupinus angustifolius]